MTKYLDYFQILGLQRDASLDDVKNAFRKLARKFHPDLNNGNKEYESKFKDISQAYEILSDPDKRKRYEQLRRFQNVDEFINDLLGKFGAEQGAKNNPQNPFRPPINLDADLNLKISFSEALQGSIRTLLINNERIKVKIPKGVKTGFRLRVLGKGNLQPGTGRRGDLYIKLDVQEHPIWKLQGELLVTELPVSLDEIVLGAKITVSTPDGPVQVTIPCGTLPGETLKVKGKGFPLNNRRGDIVFTISLKLPDQWSDEELALFNQLKSLREDDPRKDWLKSIRF